MTLQPPLYFRYLAWHYLKNLIAILFGLSFAFAAIDYFQHMTQLDVSGSYKVLYIYYMWQEALGLLYPLAIILALIMTKLTLVKQNTMTILHAFGFGKRRLIVPFLIIAVLTYALFVGLHTTSFSYAKDKAAMLLEKQLGAYNVNDLFFKYNDTFVYMKKLDPVHKKLEDVTIFKVKNNRVLYTLHAPYAIFDGKEWEAEHATVKTHIYKNGRLMRYRVEEKGRVKTLSGYKPKIIESLYEGKALNIVDAYNTWRLLKKQNLNSDKIRAALYEKTVMPLFAIALVIILFFKLPFHARMMRFGLVIAAALGVTFISWGVLFGLYQMGANGVISPEAAAVVPIVLLWLYALYVFATDERKIA